MIREGKVLGYWGKEGLNKVEFGPGDRVGVILMIISGDEVLLWPDNNGKKEWAYAGGHCWFQGEVEELFNGVSGGRKEGEGWDEVLVREIKEEVPDLGEFWKKKVKDGYEGVVMLPMYRVWQLRKGEEQFFWVVPVVVEVEDEELRELGKRIKGGVVVGINEVLGQGKVVVNGKEYPVRPPALAVLEQLRQIREGKVK